MTESKKYIFVESSESADFTISYDSNNKPYSRFFDKKWIFPKHECVISFFGLHSRFEETAKRLALKIINAKNSRSTKLLGGNIMSGAVIFQDLIHMSGGNDYSALDDDNIYNRVISYAKHEGIKYKTWKNSFIFISYLKREGFIQRDIGHADKLSKILAGDNVYSRQTLAIPERIATIYLKNAIDLVENLHPSRQLISRLYHEYLNGRASIRLSEKNLKAVKKAIYNKYHNSTHIVLDYTGVWLSVIRGACYTMLAAFTGCRDGEIRSFNLDSYEEREYANIKIPILKGIDTKPNKGGVKRQKSWVTIPAARKAIELLWESYQFSRDIWIKQAADITHVDEKASYLRDANSLLINFASNRSIRPKAGRGIVSDSLKYFVESCGYAADSVDVKEFNLLNPTRHGELKVGDVLVPHPHAFRRTFAVYLVRNKLASLLDLKYQFKHMNVAMTSWYSNQAHVASYFDMMADHELVSEIADEHHHYITDSLYYIYNEAETLAGPEGKRILNLRSNSGSSIYLSREEISQQVKEGRLSIIEHPTGHCTNPSCDRICDMTTCQYKVVTKEKALELDRLRKKLIEKFLALTEAKVNQPNILSKIYFEIRSIEKVLDEHQINHQKFTADITVAML